MTRKKTRRKVVPIVTDVIRFAIEGAAVTDTKALDKLRLIELSAIESFAQGVGTREDFKALADLLNISETLARDAIEPQVLPACLAAQEALGAILTRRGAVDRLAANAEELEALRKAYASFDLQRTGISRGRFEAAIRKTAARIRSSHPSVKVYA